MFFKRRPLILVVFSYCFLHLYSQDIIITTDSTRIFSDVLTVGLETITYTKTENWDGPIYTCPKSDVIAIKYKNGYQDIIQPHLEAKFYQLIKDTDRFIPKDTIFVKEENDPRDNFIVIDYLKFTTLSDEGEVYFVIDFSNYSNNSHNNKDGKFQFKFDRPDGNFRLKSRYRGKGQYAGVFKMSSQGSKTRFERMGKENIKILRFYNRYYNLNIELSEEEKVAFVNLFKLSSLND